MCLESKDVYIYKILAAVPSLASAFAYTKGVVYLLLQILMPSLELKAKIDAM